MLTSRTFYIAASIFVLAAGLINALAYHQYLFGFGIAAWGFVMLVLTPERKRTPQEQADAEAWVARLVATRRVRQLRQVELPIEWEDAMAAKAPPLDPMFFDAIKRG